MPVVVECILLNGKGKWQQACRPGMGPHPLSSCLFGWVTEALIKIREEGPQKDSMLKLCILF